MSFPVEELGKAFILHRVYHAVLYEIIDIETFRVIFNYALIVSLWSTFNLHSFYENGAELWHTEESHSDRPTDKVLNVRLESFSVDTLDCMH